MRAWDAFLVAQLEKNPPAMRETWVGSLGWEDALEKGTDYPLQYAGLENSMDCIVYIFSTYNSAQPITGAHYIL